MKEYTVIYRGVRFTLHREGACWHVKHANNDVDYCMTLWGAFRAIRSVA